MAYKYSTLIGENCAKAVGIALPISRKQSILVCSFIRNKNVQLAKKHLAEVIEKKRAVPFTRFNGDVGHKAGMAAGRYPVKACQQILALLESAESNAQFKGLSTADLIISHISAQKGPDTWRYGRHIRRQAKRTHVEIVLEERKKAKQEKPAKKKVAKKESAKQQEKPEVKKEKPKAEPKPEVKKETKKAEEKVEKKQEKPEVKIEVPEAEPKPAVKEEKKQEVESK